MPNGKDGKTGKRIKQNTFRQVDMCSRLKISWKAQYYSNDSGKLLQSHPDITPTRLENSRGFVGGKRTCQHDPYTRQLITPI